MAFFSFPDQVLTAGRGFRRPGQFYDLPSGMLLGADPQLVAGYGGDMPQFERKPVVEAPALLQPNEPVEALPPLTVAPKMTNPFVGPIQEAPSRSITFSTPSGVQETARYGGDNRFLGGNFRGNDYGSYNDRNRAVMASSLQDGLNETGISGVPSVRGIMENQLFGLNMHPDQKRMMALGIQKDLMHPMLALQRDKLQGEFAVKEAEARRREMLNAQQSQIMQYEMMRFEEANPRATLEDKIKHRDMIASTRGFALPGMGSAAPQAAAEAVNPIQKALSDNAYKRLESVFAGARGPRGESLPFTPTEESASALMQALATAPEADRGSVIDRAIALSAGNPEILKMVVRNMARNHMLMSGTRLNRANMLVDAATSGLPFDIRTTGSKGYAALGGVPSVAVLPNNVNIPLHYRDKPSEYSRLGVDSAARQQMLQENEVAKNYLLAAIQQGLLTR